MSENHLSRTSSCEENVKLSQLVTTSAATAGMLTPPMSVKSLQGGDALSAKEAKKAAKLAKKKEKKGQKNEKTANPKSTLNDQIFQSFVEQLCAQATKDLTNNPNLIQKLIGFNDNFRHGSISNCEKPLPPLPTGHANLLASSIRKLHAAYSYSLLESKDESASISRIVSQYGRTTHMGVLDPSYKYFLNEHHTGAIYYKVHNHVAVVAGDPLCAHYQIDDLLQEFQKFRHKMGLDMAFMGASDSFAQYARRRNWTTMHFGWDRILNPTTNALLNDQGNGLPQPSSTKRMLTQNRSLLNPDKGNLEIGIYLPSLGQDDVLQEQLRTIYDNWRQDRNEKRANTTQAFITVYDPFSLPKMMVYIYTRDRKTGEPNGFAALRKLGAHKGYQLDPCIAAPGCELRGISDLLVYASLVLLHHAKIA
ncbi:uncharacterized protein FA14DRAFT_56156 [Meira miltonrushii]|uniref:Phosphatidylglycerol lysyltransferase C-terminal domain-containing protein n=1 Tax=Meira miltonrushii TaxID=1280837 RepID=A0A316VAE2_9BASI|nr:uncharacterized protein FA14DRAFT_56156 [Meira miltonrushii]PWN33153.1 hypothetical protein FA14DRAFT_56156 [Meira miltonrushii]